LLFVRAPRLRLMTAGVGFRRLEKETLMSWTTPRVIEIAVGMEINCYACADI
jgi:coenzyme PQQ precursor peptide PqqA